MCQYKAFVRAVSEDLDQAKKIAKQIIKKEYHGKKY